MTSPARETSRIVDGRLLTIDILEGGGPLAPVWASRERVETAHGPVWVTMDRESERAADGVRDASLVEAPRQGTSNVRRSPALTGAV